MTIPNRLATTANASNTITPLGGRLNSSSGTLLSINNGGQLEGTLMRLGTRVSGGEGRLARYLAATPSRDARSVIATEVIEIRSML